jgi:hypothetical protein
VSLLILVDDEPDVETLFCHQFRRNLRTGVLRAGESARDVTLELLPKFLTTAYGEPTTKWKSPEHGAEGLPTKAVDFTVLRGEIELQLGLAA